MKPAPRLLRTARDGELAARDWLRWLGFEDADVTPGGKDGGVDVRAKGLVAQVKMEARPSARPQLQRLSGVATAVPGTATAFFSLAGFSSDARGWAHQVGMALFRFDLQGEPKPVNDSARLLFSEAEEAEQGNQGTSAAPQAEDPLPAGAYRRLEDLPRGYRGRREGRPELLPAHFRPLDWPVDRDGLPRRPLDVAGDWPIDPTDWAWVDVVNDNGMLAALEFRHRLRPRPELQFGSGVSGVGWAWLAMEVDAPPGAELYAVETADLPSSSRLFNLDQHGMTPPVTAYCTSLQAIVAYTRPWREAVARADGFVTVVSAREVEASKYRVMPGATVALPLVDKRDAPRWAAETLQHTIQRFTGTGELLSANSPVGDVSAGATNVPSAAAPAAASAQVRESRLNGGTVPMIVDTLWSADEPYATDHMAMRLTESAGRVLISAGIHPRRHWLVETATWTTAGTFVTNSGGDAMLVPDGLLALAPAAWEDGDQRHWLCGTEWTGQPSWWRVDIRDMAGRVLADVPRVELGTGRVAIGGLSRDGTLVADLTQPPWTAPLTPVDACSAVAGVIAAGNMARAITADATVVWEIAMADELRVVAHDLPHDGVVLVANDTDWHAAAYDAATARLDLPGLRYHLDTDQDAADDLDAAINALAEHLAPAMRVGRKARVEARDRLTGQLLWSRERAVGLEESLNCLAVVGGCAMWTEPGVVRRLDARDGTPIWTTNGLWGRPIDGDGPFTALVQLPEPAGDIVNEEVLVWPETGTVQGLPAQARLLGMLGSDWCIGAGYLLAADPGSGRLTLSKLRRPW